MKKILFSLLLVTILFSCSKNGDKVSQDFMEVYYKDGITKQEAQKALDYFLPRWKEKDGETYDGISDIELRYRQRYIDLAVNAERYPMGILRYI